MNVFIKMNNESFKLEYCYDPLLMDLPDRENPYVEEIRLSGVYCGDIDLNLFANFVYKNCYFDGHIINKYTVKEIEEFKLFFLRLPAEVVAQSNDIKTIRFHQQWLNKRRWRL